MHWKTTNIQCNASKKYTESAECRLKAHSWEVSLLQMDVILKQPLSPTVRQVLYILYSYTYFFIFSFRYTFNFFKRIIQTVTIHF